MTAHVLTRAELPGVGGRAVGQRRAEGYASQARHGPNWVRNKIEKAMQAAFDKAVEEGLLTPKGLNEQPNDLPQQHLPRSPPLNTNRCIAAADDWYLGWPVEARHGPPVIHKRDEEPHRAGP
jgi:hypothetical protein